MNEIVELLQQKAGLSENQAREIAQAIVNIIRSKVPEQMQGMVNSVLGAGQANAPEVGQGGLGSLLGAASGFLGGNKS